MRATKMTKRFGPRSFDGEILASMKELGMEECIDDDNLHCPWTRKSKKAISQLIEKKLKVGCCILR